MARSVARFRLEQRTWSPLLLSVLAVSAAFADSPTERDLYVRRSSWSETMLATRASYAQWAIQRAGSPTAAVPSTASVTLAGDAPAHSLVIDVSQHSWLRLNTVREEGVGNCHVWGDAVLVDLEGREVPLSQLEPFSVSVGWGRLHRNENWQGEPLCIGDRKFEHGIWVHADSDVSYALSGNYVRFSAQVGMDAARPKGRARFTVSCDAPALLPAIWKRMATDFPRQSQWFERDLQGRHLDWLARNPDVSVREAIERAAGQLGPFRSLTLAALQPLAAGQLEPEAQAWCEFYVRCRQLSEVVPLAEAIWIAPLQQAYVHAFAPLLSLTVPADDARWGELTGSLRQSGEILGNEPWFTAEGWARAVSALSRVLPDRFARGDHLQAQLQSAGPRWERVFESVVAADPDSASQLRDVVAEIRQLRQATLENLGGMAEFLAAPSNRAMPDEWQRQYRALELDLRNRAQFHRVADTTYRPESLILDSDRDPVDVVLRRTRALYDHLASMPDSSGLEPLAGELADVQRAVDQIEPQQIEARQLLFAHLCRIRRQIALRNPLLDFNEIVFIKRHRALFNHMCDQYYGIAATPGGGLYVLSDAFGADPQLRDVLEHVTVSAPSRLAGQRLAGGPTTPPNVSYDGEGNRHGEEQGGGTFLSPDLSYDGRQILFAYVENTGDPHHRHHVDPSQGHWDEGRCYHIFRVNLDGTELTQLTDGTWNDFDPCWLPNGRIAFITERRGGYLRCGRVCPNYTLFDMAADGGDMHCLSFHETNEWHPSVTNDGLILWTRWDYVDRHGCTAHKPWVTTIDGRDPRPVHGNYSIRSARPDMEVDCRAIPKSQKLIATAAPHHGQSYGSLVLIDPRVEDDDAMAPVRRVTPEVGFPETQGGGQVYGTPWPLSEDYYLCVYDSTMQPGAGQQGGQMLLGDYGIYLVDAFGNRELIYRDPAISCLSPIPVRSRPMPPRAPEMAVRGAGTNPVTRPSPPVPGPEPEGTVAVFNLYDSLKPWPEGTKITALRVLQVFPMSVPSGRPPHETGIRIASAGDSVVPVRHVLGSVPVEEDGSAYFRVPANREVFFQALDEDGLAVQSMRSATHVREGERLFCTGCHIQRHRVAEPAELVPLAMLREPSELQPDVEGSNPFSYPRLVQGVLDRHCVECHQQNADTAPNLGREPIERNWFASYNSLAPRFGFHDYRDDYRTTPGQFGARASGLYQLLSNGHYDVHLSKEEMYRLTLWLDCVSMFYGVYEQEQGQAQLRGEVAYPTLE